MQLIQNRSVEVRAWTIQFVLENVADSPGLVPGRDNDLLLPKARLFGERSRRSSTDTQRSPSPASCGSNCSPRCSLMPKMRTTTSSLYVLVCVEPLVGEKPGSRG